MTVDRNISSDKEINFKAPSKHITECISLTNIIFNLDELQNIIKTVTMNCTVFLTFHKL